MKMSTADNLETLLSSMLHQPCLIREAKATINLPLAYRNKFNLYHLTINCVECLIVEPVEQINLSQIRRQYQVIKRSTGLQSAFYLQQLTYYAKGILIREGIPFIWVDHFIYLPFMGIILNSAADREVKSIRSISFLTQKMLLISLYESWTDVTVTRASQKLAVSKMSATRCFDEISALHLPFLEKKGRSRLYSADPNKENMWSVIQPVMRNPLIRTFYLCEVPDSNNYLRSGYSALSDYSMLEDNVFPTYALTKDALSQFRKNQYAECLSEEQPLSIVQELGYQIPFLDGKDIDPLSVSLIISQKDREDPRVDKAIDEMLENYVW